MSTMAPLKLNQIKPFLNQPTSQLTAKNQSRRENQAATNQLQHLQPARSQIQPSKSVSPKKPKLTPTSSTPRLPSSELTQRFQSPFI